MTPAVNQIKRLRKHISVPRGEAARAAQLDAAVTYALDGMVEAALAQEGLRPEEQICVDRVALSLQVGPHESGERFAAAFARAFATAVRTSLARRDGRVVRYRSPSALLVDLVRSVAAGDVSRAWAWASLGLWPADSRFTRSERADAVLAVLARTPELAAEVMHQEAVAAQVLIELASPRGRAELAATWLDGSRGARQWLQTPTPMIVLQPQGADLAPRPPGPRWLQASIVAVARALAPVGVERRSAALLALIVAAPQWLQRPMAERVAVVEQLIGPAAPRAAPAIEAREPSSVSAALDLVRPAAGHAEAVEQAPSVPQLKSAVEFQPSLSEPVREGVATEFGGLLFLLNLVGTLEWLGADAELSAFDRRSVLYALATRLLPLPVDDAAALAFAGLVPGRLPPEISPELNGAAALEGLRTALVSALRVRCERAAIFCPKSDEALLSWLCRRHAVITADPGWFDVELRLDEVSTDVRRAGFDLDPGYLPWLGVVVRFRYA